MTNQARADAWARLAVDLSLLDCRLSARAAVEDPAPRRRVTLVVAACSSPSDPVGR